MVKTNYASEDIARVIESNEGEDYSLKMVIQGEKDKTKFWNITQAEARLIEAVIKNRDYQPDNQE